MTHNLVYELDGLAVGMASPSLARDIVSSAAREIDRLSNRPSICPHCELQMLKQRVHDLLAHHVDLDDLGTSDAEFVYRLSKRFLKAWNAKQALIDPTE